jgi:CheY-like chemotaxis protein
MDMTDLNRAPPGITPLVPEESPENDHWRDLLSELGAEMATPLTAALDRVQSLVSTGRIDRSSLRSLGEEIQRARHISMSGQQLARLASGRVRQTHERMPLTETLKDVLSQRSSDIQSSNVNIKQILRPVEVVVDASLLFSLLNTLLSWSLENARSNIELRADIKTWPTHARLACRFVYRLADTGHDIADEALQQSALNSMSWRLLQQTAWTMGLPIDRKVEGASVLLTIEFPRTITEQLEGVTAIELDQGFAPSINNKPLAGSQVLVVASRRDVRVQVRDAMRNMGMIVDFVNSVEEARDFCRGGLPHAIVIESVLRGDRFNELRSEVDSEGTDVVFIEIIEEGNTFEISGFGGRNMARVGRDAILTSLPSALMFELSKTI